MSGKNAYLTVKREHSLSGGLRAFSLLVDNTLIDKINSGETKEFSLPPGRRTVHVEFDFYKSKPLVVDLRPGQSIAMECGTSGPKSIRDTLSLEGLGRTVSSIVSPQEYLYLKQTGAGPRKRLESASAPSGGASPRRVARKKERTIFLSYRREDSRAITGRISDRLTNHFGKRSIFRDVDSIPIGADYRVNIQDTIAKSDIVIAVIGPKWIDSRDKDNRRRLDSPEDFVRVEIEAALEKEIPVIPVLVEAAEMPKQEELPESLAPLAFRNALFIPLEPFFHAGMDKLIEEIEGAGGADRKREARRKFCIGCGRPLANKKFCTNCGLPT